MELDGLPVISTDPVVQAHYAEMRGAGESHRLAEMLALGRGPGLVTDSTFRIGWCNGNQFADCPARGDWYKAEAEKSGLSTVGKQYLPQLADFPGDPAAWVNGRGDVLAVAKAKGFTVDGLVNYKAEARPPMPDVAIAPEIIEREVRETIAGRPDLAGQEADIRERLRALRTGRVDPNPLLVKDDGPEL